MRSRNRFLTTIIGAAFAATQNVAFAQVSGTWLNPNGGSWLDSANWNSHPQYPDGGGTAVFPSNLRNSTTITLGSNVALSRIELHGPTVYSPSGGTLTLVGPASVFAGDVAGSIPGTPQLGFHTIFTSLTGTDGLTKDGPGAVWFQRPLYTGGTTINSGTIAVSLTTISFGASTNSVTLNGGALSSISSGMPTLNQSIAVTEAGGIIGVYVSSTLNQGSLLLNGSITGAGSLLFASVAETRPITLGGAVTVSGPITAHANITLRDSAVISNAATLHLSGSITLNNGTTSALSDRIADAIPLYLRGGGIGATGAGGAGLTERIGTVMLERGLDGFGTGPKFEVSQLNRSPNTVLTINSGADDDTLQILGAAPPLSGAGAVGTPDVGIIPWARQIGTGTSSPAMTALPVTIENGYIRRLAASEYINSVPVGATSSNLRLNGSASVSAPATVNSLTMDSGTLSGASTLTVTSGAIFLPNQDENTPTVIEAPIDFGSAQGILHARSNVPYFLNPVGRLDGPISGSGGLIIAGEVGLNGLSTYTGQTIILNHAYVHGNVVPGQPGPLGMDTSAVILDPHGPGSELVLRPTLAAPTTTFGRDIVVAQSDLRPARITVGTPYGWIGAATVSGNIQLNGPLELDAHSGSSHHRLTISGNISGTGAITSRGLFFIVSLTGDNTFSGGFNMPRGTQLELGSDTALGSGTAWFGNIGITAINGPRTIANEVVIRDSSVVFYGSDPVTFTGSVNLLGLDSTLTIEPSVTTTFRGPIFNGNLSKSGAGSLVIGRLTLGSFTVSQDAVRALPDNAASVVRGLSIANGASLDLSNNDLIIDYTGASPLATIQQYLADDRLFSSYNIATTLGYGENSILGYTTFGGQAVDSTTLLIKHTYFGDANLDGAVNAYDLLALATNWLSPGPWTSGDFDGNGIVNAHDLGLMSLNWQSGNNAPLAVALDELGLPTVPEPAGIGAIALVLCSLARSRRRK